MILINQAQWNKNLEKVLQKKKKLEPELKPKFEESIADRTILRKQRLNEIAKKEEYFEYSSPSNMYKNLNTPAGIEENKTRVNKIKNS